MFIHSCLAGYRPSGREVREDSLGRRRGFWGLPAHPERGAGGNAPSPPLPPAARPWEGRPRTPVARASAPPGGSRRRRGPPITFSSKNGVRLGGSPSPYRERGKPQAAPRLHPAWVKPAPCLGVCERAKYFLPKHLSTEQLKHTRAGDTVTFGRKDKKKAGPK